MNSQENSISHTSSNDAAVSTKTKIKRWVLILLFCFTIVLVLGGIKFWQIQQTILIAQSYPERSASVTAITAELTQWQDIYKTIGEVRSPQYLELKNEVDGVISVLNFQGGDTVAKGQLLLQLNSKEEQASIDAAQAELVLAELQLTRLSELRHKNLTSKNEYDRAEANRNVLRANISALTAKIEKKSIYAPFSAQVGLHHLQVGQYLSANSKVAQLNGLQKKLWVDFSLPQEFSALAVGSKISLSAQNILAQSLTATIISADPLINTTSRQRRFRALLENAPESILPGVMFTITVNQGKPLDVFKLPSNVVRRNSIGAQVYVLTPAEQGAPASHRATYRSVIIHATEGQSIIVLSGLNVGDLLANVGAFKLQDGMLADVVSEQQSGSVGELDKNIGKQQGQAH